MKRKESLMLILLLAASVILSGCVEEESSNAFKMDSSKELAVDSNTRIMLVLSDKHYYNEKQIEIKEKLERQINNGSLNVVGVKTSYSEGYLTSAEITYNSTGHGEGNSLRALFLLSDKHYYNEKQEEIKSKMEETVNSGKYKIVKIQTTYASGYLIAAEIYYTV